MAFGRFIFEHEGLGGVSRRAQSGRGDWWQLRRGDDSGLVPRARCSGGKSYHDVARPRGGVRIFAQLSHRPASAWAKTGERSVAGHSQAPSVTGRRDRLGNGHCGEGPHRRGHWQKQGTLLRPRAGEDARRKILHHPRPRRSLRSQDPPRAAGKVALGQAGRSTRAHPLYSSLAIDSFSMTKYEGRVGGRSWLLSPAWSSAFGGRCCACSVSLRKTSPLYNASSAPDDARVL